MSEPSVTRNTVLAYLDGLSDDAAAHIYPSDLEKCMTSECVVEVVSVRAGNGDESTVPLFSREQVVAALAAPAQQPWQYTPPAQERIDALELEVRQLTEQIAGLRHAPTPQADSQPAQVLVYPPLPEPFIGVKNQPWVGHAEVIRSAIGEDGVIPWFTAGQMVAYADATHAARAPADSVLEDAARYQWIRGPGEESTRYSRWLIEYWDGPNGWQPMQRERMDSAIDAATNKGGAA